MIKNAKRRFKQQWCAGGEDMSPFFSKKLASEKVVEPHLVVPPNQCTKINFEGFRPYTGRRENT